VVLNGELEICGMGFREDEFSLEKIKAIDLVDYLASLGFQPEKPSRNGIDFYYRSPIRNESNPSFHVNRKKNIWFDHGQPKGGNLVDFGITYFNCTVREFMDKFSGDFSFHQQISSPPFDKGPIAETESKIMILNDMPLSSYPLKHYLHDRHITVATAGQYCREVNYQIDGRTYYGIGFKNDAGGYEIRNAYMKQSSSPKDITSLVKGAAEVHVFEGFMDFLSYQTMHQNGPGLSADFIILNGVAFFEKARPVMEQHQVIRLWLDRDTTGTAYTKYALSLKKGYTDESGLYSQHKDLNDWLTNKGLVQKKQLKQKIS
jgi:hypothetical protein